MAGCLLRSGSTHDACGTVVSLVQHSTSFPVALTMIGMNGLRQSKFPRRSDMVAIKLKHVVEDTDRHGNIRHYFRRKGQPKIWLRGIPCSDEFMEAYRAALASTEQTPQQRNMRTAAGSLGYVCLNYYASPTFKALDPSTRHQRSYFLDLIRKSWRQARLRIERGMSKCFLKKGGRLQQQPGTF